MFRSLRYTNSTHWHHTIHHTYQQFNAPPVIPQAGTSDIERKKNGHLLAFSSCIRAESVSHTALFLISPVQPYGDKATVDQKLHHCPGLPSQGAGNDLMAIHDNLIPQNYSALVRQSEYRFDPIGLRISCTVLTLLVTIGRLSCF